MDLLTGVLDYRRRTWPVEVGAVRSYFVFDQPAMYCRILILALAQRQDRA